MDLKGVIKDLIDDRLRDAGETIVAAQREALSDSGTKEIHSHPGEAPRRQTGRLADSFSFTVVDGELRVTTDCPYAQFLMDGTAKIAPRDVLAGYHDIRNQVIDIIKGNS